MPLLPEICCWSRACALLLIDLFLDERDARVTYCPGAADRSSLLAVLRLRRAGIDGARCYCFNGMFVRDPMATC